MGDPRDELSTRSIQKAFSLTGCSESISDRCEVVVQRGEYVGRKGHGQYVRRGLSQYLV